ncbi:MAG: ABC transporter ATP-binding protein, partial [Parcubacteria group bacterium]|nr:ABC transporter ATP-binding protein [Parcubacteria group bacterium]
EFFGFLGPNGAGKTTTIHSVTGIARFSEGSIKTFGIDVVEDYREARKKIGLSPQEYNVDIFATSRKIVDWVGGFYGMKKAEREERIGYLFDRFDLAEHADKKFKDLSGGLKRRVMLARAMVHDPELLILDEPTSGVDVELRHELWRFLQELNAEGKTILLTSHYLEEVEFLCKRIAIINHGKIVAIGDRSDFVGGEQTLEKRYLEIIKKDKND